MNQNKVGSLIFALRKEQGLTQLQLGERIGVSHKTVSKWERGHGCPDLSLLPHLAQMLGVSMETLLGGALEQNPKIGGNMRKLQFFVCPTCGNLLTATGEADIACCSKKLLPLHAAKAEGEHLLQTEQVEDELFVTAPSHGMAKEHYLAFVAQVTGDKLFISKQYPEWNMQFRFHPLGRGRLYFYCTQHGLFYQNL